MASLSSPSPSGVLAVLLGAVVSIATQCGPHDPWEGGWDTGGLVDTDGWTGSDEPDAGFTKFGAGSFSLRGEGAVAVVTVQATLSERCLSESPDYAWGYPTGWAVLAHELRTDPPAEGAEAPEPDVDDADTAEGDTGADTATSDADTGGDTATSDADTGATDTAAPDTGAPDTADTGARDTGAPDTADTGARDTGAPDTADTGTSDTADTGTPADTADGVVVVRLVLTDANGTVLTEEDDVISPRDPHRDSLIVERPFVGCDPDVACAVPWTYTLTLVSGAEAHGEIEADIRLNMCSAGDPVDSDLTVTVE